MSIETRVNGNLIGYVHIRNVSQVDDENFIYHVEYHQFDKGSKVINFDVAHKKSNSSEKLSLIIYQEINRILKKK